MDNLINKPRVFISHSSKDEDFIKKVTDDFRRCQINYWIFTEQMRDGRSWQKMIFEHGIPSCDAVLAYFTENALISKVVEKEIDAALLGQLSENEINFLPYVEKAELRKKLRYDIRTLHCEEWNLDNYNKIMPTVVAEIWRSYSERIINLAIAQEKNKRLKLELDLKKMEEKSIFSQKEEKEFQYFFQELNVIATFVYNKLANFTSEKIDFETAGIFKVPFIELVCSYLNTNYLIDEGALIKGFDAFLRKKKINFEWGNRKIDNFPFHKLRTFGLIQQENFTKKMYRFQYWLEFNKLISSELSFERIK